MRNLFVLFVLAIFAGPAFATYRQADPGQSSLLIEKVQTALLSHFENKRSPNCIMPNNHGIGFLFERNGKKYSRDFFFTTSVGESLDNTVFVDDQNGSILIKQQWLTNANFLLVQLTPQGLVQNVELKAGANLTVKCIL